MQTSYRAAMAVGKVGGIADETEHNISTFVAPAASEIPFGRLVVVDTAAPDTGDETAVCKLPASAAEVATANAKGGVSVASQAHVTHGVLDQPTYKAKELVGAMRQGRVWVYSEANVTKGDPCYARHTANGGLDQLGAFSNAAGTGLALVKGAYFTTSAVAGALAKLELNLGGV